MLVAMLWVTAALAETVALDVVVDISPRPEEDGGGNVFLVGFDELDATGHPEPHAPAADMQQLGSRVKTWPLTASVELQSGLHYQAMYGFADHPQESDRMSELALVDAAGMEFVIADPGDTPSLPATGGTAGQVEGTTGSADAASAPATSILPWLLGLLAALLGFGGGWTLRGRRR